MQLNNFHFKKYVNLDFSCVEEFNTDSYIIHLSIFVDEMG